MFNNAIIWIILGLKRGQETSGKQMMGKRIFHLIPWLDVYKNDHSIPFQGQISHNTTSDSIFEREVEDLRNKDIQKV